MSKITIELPDDIAERLRQEAEACGQAVDGYVARVVQRAVAREDSDKAYEARLAKLRSITDEEAKAHVAIMMLGSPPVIPLPPGKSIWDILDEHWPREDDCDVVHQTEINVGKS